METSNQPSFFQAGFSFSSATLRAQSLNQSIDQSDVGPVVIALDAIGHGNIFGHEDVGFDSGGGGVGSEGASGVSGGGDSELLQSEVPCHGDGGGETSRFERASGIQALRPL